MEGVAVNARRASFEPQILQLHKPAGVESENGTISVGAANLGYDFTVVGHLPNKTERIAALALVEIAERDFLRSVVGSGRDVDCVARLQVVAVDDRLDSALGCARGEPVIGVVARRRDVVVSTSVMSRFKCRI